MSRAVAVRARRIRAAVPGPAYDDAVVVIADGRVRAIGPASAVPVGGDMDVLDLGDAVIVPGLIDAHVHLALEPTGPAPAAVLGVPDADITARMISNAHTLLAAGITTARDLGAPLAPALATRTALAAAGRLRLLVAGAPITGVEAHLHFFGGAVATAADAAELVWRQVAAGVDWIKLVLSGGEITPGSHPRAPALSEPAARSAVTAAHDLGRPVAVHAHTAAAARLAVELGVETVEHCTLLDAGAGQTIAPAVVCPTANARWLDATADELQPRAARLADLRRGGSRLIAGTDAGIPGVGFDAYADGLLALHRAGLTPEQVLAGATSEAASALGLTDRGALEPGRLGDLVACADDPLENLGTLRHPQAVLVGGRRVSAR